MAVAAAAGVPRWPSRLGDPFWGVMAGREGYRWAAKLRVGREYPRCMDWLQSGTCANARRFAADRAAATLFPRASCRCISAACSTMAALVWRMYWRRISRHCAAWRVNITYASMKPNTKPPISVQQTANKIGYRQLSTKSAPVTSCVACSTLTGKIVDKRGETNS